jgi:hypothetical protein
VVRWRHHLDHGWPAGSRQGQSGGGVKTGGEPPKDENAEIDKPVHRGKAAVNHVTREEHKDVGGGACYPCARPNGELGMHLEL